MASGTWKGWEYETSNGLHMYVSKRHYFDRNSGQAVCGARPPRHIGAHADEGDYACRRCERIVDNLERGQ